MEALTFSPVGPGGDNPLHGPGGAGGGGKPEGLRVSAEAGGHVRPGPHLLGDLHEMHRPFPW